MFGLIIGGLLLLFGAIMLWGVWDEGRKKEDVKFLPTSSIGSLLTIHSNIRDNQREALMTLFERCKISGIIDASESDEAAYERQPVLYKTRIKQKNTSGKIVQTHSNEDWQSKFWVRDDTGRMLVDPLGATIELFRPQTTETKQEIRTERALRVGQPVCIMGWLTDFHGQPIIANKGSTEGGVVNAHYVITWRSPQALIEETSSTILALKILGPISVLLGSILIALGFMF